MTSVGQHKFHTLDAMRGVAAVIVMMFHFRSLLPPLFGKYELASSGYLAVDLFFLLSGFVIAHAYDEPLRRGLSVNNFVGKRLIRLWPMIWIGAAIGGANLFFNKTLDPISVMLATVFNAALLPFPLEGFITPTNVAEWSLIFELAANTLFAWTFFVLRKSQIVALIAACAVVVAYSAHHFGHLDKGPTPDGYYVGTARVGFSFFTGVLMYRTRHDWSRYLGRIVAPAWAVVMATAIVLMLPVPLRFHAGYDSVFVLLVSPLLVMLASRSEPGERGGRIAARLGVLSYPLYAIHLPIKEWVQATIARPDHSTTWAVLAVMILTVPLSFLLAYRYDAPVRKWLSRQWHLRASSLP